VPTHPAGRRVAARGADRHHPARGQGPAAGLLVDNPGRGAAGPALRPRLRQRPRLRRGADGDAAGALVGGRLHPPPPEAAAPDAPDPRSRVPRRPLDGARRGDRPGAARAPSGAGPGGPAGGAAGGDDGGRAL
ncbi:MAG: Ribosome-binding factor A, partial [uncultured Thermomicrobiales bacterium]